MLETLNATLDFRVDVHVLHIELSMYSGNFSLLAANIVYSTAKIQ